MGFYYKMKLVTLENYKEIFKGFTSDALDEIRSAILDGTPIGNYINNDADGYTLGQHRKAIRELLPVKYFSRYTSGEVMYNLRVLFAKRGELGLEQVKAYIQHDKYSRMDDESILEIIKAVVMGADISRVDFHRVRKENVALVCSGLVKKFPMWLCAEENISTETMEYLMKGMLLGIDVHPFIKGDWDNEVLVLLFGQAKAIDVGELVSCITNKFDVGCVEEIVQAMRLKLDYSLLCAKDTEGRPVFNEYQMEVISKCLLADVLTEEIYNPRVSDIEMQDLYLAELEKRAKSVRRLGGSLKRGMPV